MTVDQARCSSNDRLLEHYSHIRIDAKRQALDALDAAGRSTAHNGDGYGDGANQTEIPAIVEVSDDLTSRVGAILPRSLSPPPRRCHRGQADSKPQ